MKMEINQAEAELLNMVYDEKKTPAEMVEELSKISKRSMAELAGDAIRNTSKKLEEKQRTGEEMERYIAEKEKDYDHTCETCGLVYSYPGFDKRYCALNDMEISSSDSCAEWEDPKEGARAKAEELRMDSFLVKEIADNYGYESQSEKCIEECGELIQAICKDRQNMKQKKIGKSLHLAEELADVFLTATQVAYLRGIGEEVLHQYRSKIDRQLDRIVAENQEDTEI